MLHGAPLEEADLGQGGRLRLRSRITEILGEPGLSCGIVDIATVHSGRRSLEAAMIQLASKVDVIVCDAQTDDDLQSVANASLALGSQTVWAGSAGLARHMPPAAGFVRRNGPLDPVRERGLGQGPTLFVVGSLAGASREQARALAAAPDIETVAIQLSAPSNEQSPGRREHAGVAAEALRHGKDVLLIFDFPERHVSEQSQNATRSLARIVESYADHVGALVVTGGETARAVLDAWGVSRLRLLGEVEPGLPYSLTEGWSRDILVLTKAGGFGTRETFLHCREFLKANKHSSRTIA
jgi:4-hydroxythreonine-4-phosphate dehydrogenase